MKRTSAALLAVSILLAACGGDAKPDPSSSNSPTTTSPSPTTTSASPTTTSRPTTDPDIPAAARAHTPAGAESFVRYFIERLNVAWTTPLAGILSPLCQDSSKACTAYEKTATRLITEGHRYDGDPLTIGSIGALVAPTPNKLDVIANVVQQPRSEIDASGKTYVTDQRKNLRLDFELLQTGQSWSVESIKIMK